MWTICLSSRVDIPTRGPLPYFRVVGSSSTHYFQTWNIQMLLRCIRATVGRFENSSLDKADISPYKLCELFKCRPLSSKRIIDVWLNVLYLQNNNRQISMSTTSLYSYSLVSSPEGFSKPRHTRWFWNWSNLHNTLYIERSLKLSAQLRYFIYGFEILTKMRVSILRKLNFKAILYIP